MIKRNASHALFIFSAGLALGWLVKKMIDSGELKPQTQKIMATANEVRRRLEDSDQTTRIKNIFGKTTKDVTRIYEDTKDALIGEIDTLKLSFDDIDKQKYVGIVTELMQSLRKERQLPDDQVDKLSQALISDFKKIRSNYSQLKTTKETIASEIDKNTSEI